MATRFPSNVPDGLVSEEERRLRAQDKESNLRSQYENAKRGGTTVSADDVQTLSRFNLGAETGRRLLDDTRLKDIESRYKDLSQGFSGKELGARRGIFNNQINAQENTALARLRSDLGRGGVGGARSAALQGGLRSELAKTNQDTERKLLLDEGQQIRQGLGDYSSLVNQKKLLEAGLGVGFGQLGSAKDAADAASAANKGGKGK